MIKLRILFISLLILQNCLSQENLNINLLTQKITNKLSLTDKDKLLLVTDRKIYAAGENVYFKVFLVDSINNYIQINKQKLYVDWVNEKDKVMNRLVLTNTNFKTSGRFILPDSLSEGFYWIRAYSKKILNTNINNIAVVPFYVVGEKRSLKDSLAHTIADASGSDSLILQFYPEGGSIISGLNSTIAVSAKNKNGKPLMVFGIIKDNNDSVAAAFSTNKYGLAKFSYYPKWFDKYKVLVQHGTKYDSAALLPPINFYAAQLAITQQTNDYLTVQVALEDSIYSKNYTTYLIALNADSVCFTSIGKGMYNIAIPLSKFPAGVANLYLFNDKNELLSSRSVYVNKERYRLTVHPDKENYRSRDKINLSFKLTDANNKPEVAALSLSVIDKQIWDTTFSLFNNDTLQNLSQADADLIMLTQNKKINPLYLNEDDSFSKTDDDTGFTLSGKIVNLQNEPVKNAIITIFSNKPELIIETDTLKNNGEFNFNLPPYFDSTQFTFQVTNFKGKNIDNYRVTFNTDSSLQFSTPVNLKTTFVLSDSMQSLKSQLLISASTLSSASGHWLKPVTVKTYKKPQVNYDESKRVSRNSQIFTRDMLREGPNMTSIMLLNNPSVRRLFFGPPMIAGDPLVVLDGVEMPKSELIMMAAKSANPGDNPILQFINSIPVSTIDFIEVLAGPEAAAYGMEGGHGVILINTRTGSDNDLSTTANLKSFNTQGFYNDAPFEMPDYSDKQILKSKLPDLRKTIYWNGNIITNKDGETSVQFYAADLPTTYIGIVTGVTINGDKIYQTITLSRN